MPSPFSPKGLATCKSPLGPGRVAVFDDDPENGLFLSFPGTPDSARSPDRFVGALWQV